MIRINRGRIPVEYIWHSVIHVLACAAVWTSGLSVFPFLLLTALILASLVQAIRSGSWPGIGVVRSIAVFGKTIFVIGDKGKQTASLLSVESCGEFLTVLTLRVGYRHGTRRESSRREYRRRLILLKIDIGEEANRDLRRLLWRSGIESSGSDQPDFK